MFNRSEINKSLEHLHNQKCISKLQVVNTIHNFITLVNVKAPVIATTSWWWQFSALVLA